MFTPAQFTTSSIDSHPRGAAVTRILAAAFNAVHAGEAVKRFLQQQPLPPAARIFVLGLGKAAAAMTAALLETTHATATLIITKHAPDNTPPTATILLGDHPIPGEGSLRAGRAVLDFLAQLTPDDLLVCLISGGGSALMSAPIIPLPDLQNLTADLLASGARIDQINTVRRHLDLLKGGGVAQAANGARIISLILSDVVGDALEAIASGVTAPDPTTTADALRLIHRAGRIFAPRETAKPGDSVFARVSNHIIASNDLALSAAKQQAEAEGLYAEIIQSGVQGEAREVGRQMAARLQAAEGKHPRPFCLLAGGETTVTLRGRGKGGRNQEAALGAVEALRDTRDALFISIATDGEDGVTDAAGAVATSATACRAESLGVSVALCLEENNAHGFFVPLGDLLKPGASGTNVNDLMLLFAF